MICGLSYIRLSVDIWNMNFNRLFIRECGKILGSNLKFCLNDKKLLFTV